MFLSEIIIADRMRPADPGKVSELAESIKSIGLINPLTVNADGSLIAGYHRYKALLSLGWKEAPVNKMDLSQPLAELAEIDENLKRNELTKLELGKFLNMREEILNRMGLRAKVGQGRPKKENSETVSPFSFPGFEPEEETKEKPQTTAEIASEIGLSERSAQNYRQIDKGLTEETKAAIGRTEIADSTTQLLALARMTPEKQAKVAEKISAGAKSVVDATRLINKDEIKEIPPPSGKYRVIYADPPWSYGNSGAIGDDNYGRAEKHYPTMPTEDICSLPIKDIADDNSVLFLWVTSPLLEDAFKVINAWGFKYKSSFVWHKLKHNFAHYNSMRHEFLLIATRGSCLPDHDKLIPSVIDLERTKNHSEKPEYFRELVNTLYTSGEKIELFSRTEAEGWHVWGNQAGKLA